MIENMNALINKIALKIKTFLDAPDFFKDINIPKPIKIGKIAKIDPTKIPIKVIFIMFIKNDINVVIIIPIIAPVVFPAGLELNGVEERKVTLSFSTLKSFFTERLHSLSLFKFAPQLSQYV